MKLSNLSMSPSDWFSKGSCYDAQPRRIGAWNPSKRKKSRKLSKANDPLVSRPEYLIHEIFRKLNYDARGNVLSAPPTDSASVKLAEQAASIAFTSGFANSRNYLKASRTLVTIMAARFQETQDRMDLEKAISTAETCCHIYMSFRSHENFDVMPCLEELAADLNVQRFHITGNPEDLDQALSHMLAAQQLIERRRTVLSDDAHALLLYNFGVLLYEKYRATADTADLDESIAKTSQAADFANPSCPDRAFFLGSLGMMLHDRFDCCGDIADLETAIARTEAAITLLARNSPGSECADLVPYAEEVDIMQRKREGIQRSESEALPFGKQCRGLNAGTGNESTKMTSAHCCDHQLLQSESVATTASSPEQRSTIPLELADTSPLSPRQDREGNGHTKKSTTAAERDETRRLIRDAIPRLFIAYETEDEEPKSSVSATPELDNYSLVTDSEETERLGLDLRLFDIIVDHFAFRKPLGTAGTDSVTKRPTYSNGSTSRSSDSSPGYTTCATTSQSSAKSSGKRPHSQSDRQGHDGLESDDEDGDDFPRKRSRRLLGQNSSTKSRRLKCPYYQRRPEDHSENACRGLGFQGMSKLKDHLKRKHLKPLKCMRCWQAMDSLEIRDQHLQRTPICSTRPEPSDDRVCRFKLDEWSFKSGDFARAESEEQKWKLLYRKLFPDDLTIPSPYELAGLSSQTERRFLDIFEEEVRKELGPSVQDFLTKLTGVMDRTRHRLYSEFEPLTSSSILETPLLESQTSTVDGSIPSLNDIQEITSPRNILAEIDEDCSSFLPDSQPSFSQRSLNPPTMTVASNSFNDSPTIQVHARTLPAARAGTLGTLCDINGKQQDNIDVDGLGDIGLMYHFEDGPIFMDGATSYIFPGHLNLPG